MSFSSFQSSSNIFEYMRKIHKTGGHEESVAFKLFHLKTQSFLSHLKSISFFSMKKVALHGTYITKLLR